MSNISQKLVQPLRIYEAREQQNRFVVKGRSSLFTLLCPKNSLLPFQIKRLRSPLNITSVKLVSVNGLEDGSEMEIFSNIPVSELDVFSFTDEDRVVYYGQEDLTNDLPLGDYYLKITDGSQTWYTEVFRVLDFNRDEFLDNCVLTRLEYWSTCDVGETFFRTTLQSAKQFKYVFYLDIEPGKPEINYIEEGEEDGLQNFHPDLLGVREDYVLQRPVPLFMLQAISHLTLFQFDTATINIYRHNGITDEVQGIRVESEWQEPNGDFANTDVFFYPDVTVVVSCCSDTELDELCIGTTAQVVATIVEYSSDYNNHQYTDLVTTQMVDLRDGDKVFIEHRSGERTFAVYEAATMSYSYQNSGFTAGDVVVDLNKEKADLDTAYYYRSIGGNWLPKPRIYSDQVYGPGQRVVSGESYESAAVLLYAVTGSGEVFIGQAAYEDFSGSGHVYNEVPQATALRIQAAGLDCNVGQDRVFVYPEPGQGGIGFMQIENTFVVS